MHDLGWSRRLSPLRWDLEQPQGCFWLGQLELSPGISAAGLQQSHVLLPFPFLPLAFLIWSSQLQDRVGFTGICHPGISLCGRNRNLPAGISCLLCPRTLAVHVFNELAPTAHPPVWEFWFHLGSSRPCDTDLRVDEHKGTIRVLNSRVFGAV